MQLIHQTVYFHIDNQTGVCILRFRGVCSGVLSINCQNQDVHSVRIGGKSLEYELREVEFGEDPVENRKRVFSDEYEMRIVVGEDVGGNGEERNGESEDGRGDGMEIDEVNMNNVNENAIENESDNQREVEVVIEYSLRDASRVIIKDVVNEGCYVYPGMNRARYWMPCIENVSCSFSLYFVYGNTEARVIASGEWVEHYIEQGERIEHYEVDSCLPVHVLWSYGIYEVNVFSKEVYGFVNGKRAGQMNYSMEPFSKIVEFFTVKLLCAKLPFKNLKVVCVDGLPRRILSGAGIVYLNVHLLHDEKIIDDAYLLRRIISEAVAQQYFGVYLYAEEWVDLWLINGIARFLSMFAYRLILGDNEFRLELKMDMEK
ncbi:hypothetical protein ROZALSC1DRAFT_22519, partial [Rozella allomycis CSF55]